MYFFALSHAPPVFDEEIAICTPETNEPASSPASAAGPMIKPTRMGEPNVNMPGGSFRGEKIPWRS
jgi:hypothetical protein